MGDGVRSMREGVNAWVYLNFQQYSPTTAIAWHLAMNAGWHGDQRHREKNSQPCDGHDQSDSHVRWLLILQFIHVPLVSLGDDHLHVALWWELVAGGGCVQGELLVDLGKRSKVREWMPARRKTRRFFCQASTLVTKERDQMMQALDKGSDVTIDKLLLNIWSHSVTMQRYTDFQWKSERD